MFMARNKPTTRKALTARKVVLLNRDQCETLTALAKVTSERSEGRVIRTALEFYAEAKLPSRGAA